MGGYQGGAMTLGVSGQQHMPLVNSLRKSLNIALQQNSAMKSRLKKIYIDADISDIPEVSRFYLHKNSIIIF